MTMKNVRRAVMTGPCNSLLRAVITITSILIAVSSLFVSALGIPPFNSWPTGYIALGALAVLLLMGSSEIYRRIHRENLLAAQRPKIDVTPYEQDDAYFLQVRNNGSQARFSAEIEIVEPPNHHPFRGFWDSEPRHLMVRTRFG